MTDAAKGFANYLRGRGVHGFESEVMLNAPASKHRWDLVNRELKIAIEIQGGIWMPKGAHNTGTAIQRDTWKLNTTVLLGYRPLQFTSDQISKDPEGCIDVIRRVAMMK
jgi:very-short-patch-repair endonuclease